MQSGLYLHHQLLRATDVWRVVSEDSDHFRPRLAPIHRLGGLDDLHEPIPREMALCLNQPHTLCKLSEVVLL